MMNAVISFVLPFFLVICLAGTGIYIARRKWRFEQILPLALMTAALIVFFMTALFHHISFGIWLLIALGAAFPIVLIFDKKRRKTFAKLFTPGFFIFLIIYIFIFILNYKRIFSSWDEYIFWGVAVKDMWRIDDFYTSAQNIVGIIHGDYPPIIPLFETIWLKMAGQFREGLVYVALQFLCFAMILPAAARIAWDKLRRARIWANIFLVAALFISAALVINLWDSYAPENPSAFYAWIYIDAAMACLFAYGIFVAWTESDKFRVSTMVKFAIIATFMVLAKQIAIVFFAIIIMIYAAGLWFNKTGRFREKITNLARAILKPRKYYKQFLIILALAVLPILSLKVWGLQANEWVENTHNVPQFSASGIKIFELPAIWRGAAGGPSQQHAARNFVEYFIAAPAPLSSSFIKLTFWQIALILLGLLILIGHYFRARLKNADGKFAKNPTLILAIGLGVGFAIYVFAILLSYVFTDFTDSDRERLASVSRYLGTYICALTLILAMILVFSRKIFGKKSVAVFLIVLVILWGFFLNGAALKTLISRDAPGLVLSSKTVENWKNYNAEISENAVKTGDENYTITATTTDYYGNGGYELTIARYLNREHKMGFVNILQDSTPEKVKKTLVKNKSDGDYFVIDFIDEKLNNLLKEAFSRAEDFKTGEIFQTKIENGDIQLEKIN